jgi:DNA-binding NtrC family response regulator
VKEGKISPSPADNLCCTVQDISTSSQLVQRMDASPYTRVPGTSTAMRAVLERCERLARTSHPILLLGEPGTGKTLLARYIHDISGRAGAFIKQAASHIPERFELAHLCGQCDTAGSIEAAHGGTFFLDEIADASPRVQQILGQLLDEGIVRRVGEHRDRQVDVRFMAATNANLEKMVADDRFRGDLLDRLGYLTVRLPRLAERRDEILPLIDYFLGREIQANGKSVRPVLSDAVRACLTAAPWKGNIRELRSLCSYMALHCRPGGVIEMADLPPEFLASLGQILQRSHSLSLAERAREALQVTKGNKAAAARLLGISRRHIHRLLASS